MKRKVRQSLDEATVLLGSGKGNGAANRAYYALYQGVVGELVGRGKRPTDFTHPDNLSKAARDGASWPHWLVRETCPVAGLTRSEQSLYEDAMELRIRADYRPEPVHPDEVRSILTGARSILQGLGAC